MANLEEDFKKWRAKKGKTSKTALDEKTAEKKTEPITEGFLDDDNEETPVQDALETAEVPEEKPAIDPDTEDLVGDEDEKEPEETKEEEQEVDDGVSKAQDDMLGELKDVIASLNTTVQTLADKLDKQEDEAGGDVEPDDGEGDEFDDLDFGDDEETEGEGDEGDTGDGSEDTGDDGEGDAGDSDGAGDTGDTGDAGDGADDGEGEKDSGDEDYEGDDESDDTKSEAYNSNMKHGKLLNSNTGSLIGILESGKYWKLDEQIFAVVKAKIRRLVENKKIELRTKMLEESEQEPVEG